MTFRLTAMISLICCIICGSRPIWAQEEDPKARLADAKATLQKLMKRVGRLPAAEEHTRSRIPTPPTAALILKRELTDFSRLYEDLPLAQQAVEARWHVCVAAGDIGEALAMAPVLLADETLTELQRGKVLANDAVLRAKFGDLAGALKLAKDVSPQIAAAHGIKMPTEEWNLLHEQQRSQITQLSAGIKGAPGPGRNRAMHQALRFATTFPVNADSRRVLELFLKDMQEAKPQARRVLTERIVHYFPDGKAFVPRSMELIEVLVADGEYEKAQLHIHRLLDRSEKLNGGQTRRLAQVGKAVDTALKRIAARGLEPGKDTKVARLKDIRKKLNNLDAYELATLIGGFAEDYPTAAEIPELRFRAAQALATVEPADARPAYEKIVNQHANSPYGFQALEFVANQIQKDDGPEETLTWLGSNAARFKNAKTRARIDFKRAEILESLERFEEAREILKPLTEGDEPWTKNEATSRLNALKGR